MITRISDFKGHLRIPNLEGTAPLEVGNQKELELAIERYEPVCLMQLFGFELYKEIKSNVDDDGIVLPTAEQKWKDLIDGVDDYIGIREILANYIFFFFVENDESHYGGVGNIKEKSKGAYKYSFREKAVKAWRTYYELAVGKEASFTMYQKGREYGVVWNTNDYDAFKPLRVYLQEHKEDFPNQVNNFARIKNINYYGI